MSIPLETPAPPSLTIGELQELDIVSPEQFISTLDYYVEKGLSIGNVLVNIMYTITFSIEEFHLIRDAATRGAGDQMKRGFNDDAFAYREIKQYADREFNRLLQPNVALENIVKSTQQRTNGTGV